MKNIRTLPFVLWLLGISLCFSSVSLAQTQEELDAAIKASKGKTTKIARKESKRLAKEGYSNIAGEMPMDKQLERSIALSYMMDDRGNPKYFLATQVAKAETFAASKQQALQLCIADIASQIGSNILGTIKANVANNEALDDATSVTEVIGAYQNRIMAKLGRVVPVVTLKKMENKLTYINMTVRYDRAEALEMVKQDLRQELKDKANLMQDEIDKILDIK
ncbi:MAG: hypothetical protein OHK0038_04030 [Flammeovirgaceae bacterium]